ncbi:hypothetical protein L1049_012299 [Liquidambar formosana]|uniref:F-box associated beta-propeller type 3 domain-containing protein n=1 Tax=Liquidambar formosana TaxID=63359 RepID=A0AAP0RU25_LIQFO
MAERSQQVKDNRKKQRAILQHSHRELIFDILARLPGQHLHNSIRYVCKPWCNLISTPLFVKTHLHNSKHGPIIHEPMSHGGRLISLQPIKKSGQWGIEEHEFFETRCSGLIRGSCNGLLLLQDRILRRTLHVMNPITKQLMTLPKCSSPSACKQHICCYGLSFVPSTNEYKVVHLYDKGNYYDSNIGCEILTLSYSADFTWKPVLYDNSRFQSIVLRGFSSSTGVSAIGVLHWKVPSEGFIMSSDVKTETFHGTGYPNCNTWSGFLFWPGGCLALVDWTSGFQLHIWVLKDLDGGLWVKQNTVGLDLLGCLLASFNPTGVLENGVVILYIGRDVGSMGNGLLTILR